MPYEIPIAKVGDHHDRLGRPYSISEADLNEYVETYDQKRYRAPLIFRHNSHGKTDVELSASRFAFGYPQKLKRVGDTVRAVFSRISPKAKQWIDDGNVIALSPSFYNPDSPNNPTPGRKNLRHIALLGSEPPAIAGMPLELTPTELSATEDDETCFSFAASVQVDSGCLEFAMGSTLPQLFQRLRESLIADKGADEAEKILPADMLTRLTEDSFFDPSQYQWSEINALRQQIDDLQGTVKLLLKAELSEDDGMAFDFVGGNNTKLAALIRKAIENRKKDEPALTYADLGDAAGISEFTVGQILRGEIIRPPDERLRGFAKVLGIGFEDLQAAADDDRKNFYAEVEMSEPDDKRNLREIELEAELERVRGQLAEQQRKDTADFVQAQVDRGALLPGEAGGLVEVLLTLDAAQPVELSAAEGSKAQVPQAEVLRGLLKRLEPAITYIEIAKGTGDDSSDSYDFQQAPGYEISDEKKALHRKALAYQKQHPDVDIVEAYKAVGGA